MLIRESSLRISTKMDRDYCRVMEGAQPHVKPFDEEVLETTGYSCSPI